MTEKDYIASEQNELTEGLKIALKLLKELEGLHSEISSGIWISACHSLVINSYIYAGLPCEVWVADAERLFKHYKSISDNKQD